MLSHEKKIHEYEKTLMQFKEQNQANPLWSREEIEDLETKLDGLKKRVYGNLSTWERVEISRDPKRPRSVDYLRHLTTDFTEIHGDRTFRDDQSIITGFGRIDGVKFMIIAQEKGCDTESRISRNFGMPHPEGYRKAMRAMKLAAKFNLPVLSLIDTPGAYPGLAAEERGQGCAIAENLMGMARLPTPIIVLFIGEGCSGGALGIGVGDVIGILEHAYYSVISPEACASILWKDTRKNEQAAGALKIHAEDLIGLQVVDTIIEEPLGGAHHNPQEVYKKSKEFILKEWNRLKTIPLETLLEERYQKFRKMGKFLHENPS